MITKEYIELINKDIDQVITPEEKQKLQNYFTVNPEAKNYYEDLQMLTDYMSRVPESTPPAGLTQRIINSINFNKYKTDKTTSSIVLFKKLKTWAPRLGYLAIGMFVGFFIYAVINSAGGINETHVKGTIGIENKRVQNIKAIKLDDKNISGTVNLMKSGDSFWFDVDLNSVKPFELDINYQDEVELIDFSPNTLSFTKNDKTLEFDKSAGSQQFTIYFSKQTENTLLNIQIKQAGNIVIDERLQIN